MNTVEFLGSGNVQKLRCVRVDSKFQPIAGSEFDIKADLVLLAMGFVSPVHEGMIDSLGVKLTVLTKDQADYLGIPAEGPFKPDHYKY